MNADLRRKFLWSLILALLVYVVLALFADWQQLTGLLAGFPWHWLPAIVGLTLLNYVGRLLKWHWYLGLVGVTISRWNSARIFGVGMIMVMTPGKLGEFVKSYMVRNVTGVPMSVTAPVILAERLTDGLAMLLLASAGMITLLDSTQRGLALSVLGGVLGLMLLIQVRPLALWLLRTGRALPFVHRFAGQLYQFYESSYILFRPRTALIAVAIGLASWFCEGLAYYLVLTGMGVAPGLQSAATAVFIFSISTVLGAVIGTPGGLGGTESGLVALSTSLLALSRAAAGASALLVRFVTLWLGVLLGVVCLGLWPELLVEPQPHAERSVVDRKEVEAR